MPKLKMQNNIEKLKKEFLENEIAVSSIFAAFGRAKIYSLSADTSKKEEFKKFIRGRLKEYGDAYRGRILGKEHIDNIETLTDEISNRYSGILSGGRFRIGIAQKLLNLYLKYLWVLGWIRTPPHCPFDSRIISMLGIKLKCVSWTKCDDVDCYKSWVDAAKKKSGGSIAKWELEVWNETKKPIRKGQIF